MCVCVSGIWVWEINGATLGFSAIKNPCFSAWGTGLIHGWRTKIRVYVCVCVCVCAQSCPTILWPHGLEPVRLLCPWDAPGTNSGLGCHARLQGIFPTQGSKLHLLHWQADSFFVCLFVFYHWTTREVKIPLVQPKIAQKNKGAKGHNVYREEAYCGLNSVPCKILTLKLWPSGPENEAVLGDESLWSGDEGGMRSLGWALVP